MPRLIRRKDAAAGQDVGQALLLGLQAIEGRRALHPAPCPAGQLPGRRR
jgi:hypothetical protein